jgi:Fe-S-cluster-containing hydrogenase component 2
LQFKIKNKSHNNKNNNNSSKFRRKTTTTSILIPSIAFRGYFTLVDDSTSHPIRFDSIRFDLIAIQDPEQEPQQQEQQQHLRLSKENTNNYPHPLHCFSPPCRSFRRFNCLSDSIRFDSIRFDLIAIQHQEQEPQQQEQQQQLRISKENNNNYPHPLHCFSLPCRACRRFNFLSDSI